MSAPVKQPGVLPNFSRNDSMLPGALGHLPMCANRFPFSPHRIFITQQAVVFASRLNSRISWSKSFCLVSCASQATL